MGLSDDKKQATRQRSDNGGGPFRSYGFYNESDHRLYLMDYSVFAPGEKKWPFMRQLEAMARTFMVKSNDNQIGEAR